MKIIVVVGARPNFIKVAPLMPMLLSAGYDAALAHTGQHYDAAMSDDFFRDLAIPEPRWFLNVGSGTHAVQTGRAMIALEETFTVERPDAVMVVGDVNSTLAGALAASKMHIPTIHLEAGLRSFDMQMPEEVNRLVADQLSTMHLTPTREAGWNLRHEAIEAERIHFVGNIMAESVLKHREGASLRDPAAQHGLANSRYVLVTVHRPENTDHPQRLGAIMGALRELALPVIFPIHPRTRPMLEPEAKGSRRVKLIDPVGYLDMLALQDRASLVLTDSGGIQEEACMLGTPCVTVRRNTERAITVEVGSNRLVSAEKAAILAAVDGGLSSERKWSAPERWDARVSERIVTALSHGLPLQRGA
jgi:UDP-N-acetylglucosamine 2-epimerase (non-hydrolysing)